MSNPNPLIPQGSLLEQQAKSRPHLRIAICIVVIHLVFLGGLLMQGCKRDTGTDSAALNALTNDYYLPPLGDTNSSPYGSTNLGISPWPTNEPAGLLPPIDQTPPIVNVQPLPVDPQPPATNQEYTVARGDSFYSIGKKFNVSASAIAKANPGVDSTRLQIGQKLQIPAASAAVSGADLSGMPAASRSQTYTIKAGDTLTKIARTHGTTVPALKELNGLRTDRINIGQKLKLPAKSAAAEPTPGTLTPAAPGGPVVN